jgi:hypothetical protein
MTILVTGAIRRSHPDPPRAQLPWAVRSQHEPAAMKCIGAPAALEMSNPQAPANCQSLRAELCGRMESSTSLKVSTGL